MLPDGDERAAAQGWNALDRQVANVHTHTRHIGARLARSLVLEVFERAGVHEDNIAAEYSCRQARKPRLSRGMGDDRGDDAGDDARRKADADVGRPAALVRPLPHRPAQ